MLHALSQLETTTNDSLQALIRQGARDLIARTVEAESEALMTPGQGGVRTAAHIQREYG